MNTERSERRHSPPQRRDLIQPVRATVAALRTSGTQTNREAFSIVGQRSMFLHQMELLLGRKPSPLEPSSGWDRNESEAKSEIGLCPSGRTTRVAGFIVIFPAGFRNEVLVPIGCLCRQRRSLRWLQPAKNRRGRTLEPSRSLRRVAVTTVSAV